MFTSDRATLLTVHSSKQATALTTAVRSATLAFTFRATVYSCKKARFVAIPFLGFQWHVGVCPRRPALSLANTLNYSTKVFAEALSESGPLLTPSSSSSASSPYDRTPRSPARGRTLSNLTEDPPPSCFLVQPTNPSRPQPTGSEVTPNSHIRNKRGAVSPTITSLLATPHFS